jgi:hypothetical protein
LLKFYVLGQVESRQVVCIDWDVSEMGVGSVSHMINPLLKPQNFDRALDEPPTNLENLLQAYVEQEHLTGANQWRLGRASAAVRVSWLFLTVAQVPTLQKRCGCHQADAHLAILGHSHRAPETLWS